MMNLLFRLVEKDGLGKVMLAERDLLPGSVVFTETEPVMRFSKQFLEEYSDREKFAPFFAAFDMFTTSLSAAEKEAFLQLYGPTDGGQADQFRKCMRSVELEDADGNWSSFSEADVELFVRIASIMRLNAFEIHGGRAVYPIATRMSHSCLPNCALDVSASRCICRTILPVCAGEELTIEYNSEHRFRPTHERRHVYAQTKDFTCHCPRCDAPGDDTRQFACFDPTCNGLHLVCQPLDDQPLTFADRQYEGVEYVSPYLLPCTVCQRSPPADFQKHTFQLEASIEHLLSAVHEEICSLEDVDIAAKLETIQRLVEQPYPKHHSAAIGLNDLLLAIRWEVLDLTGECHGLAEAGRRALKPFEQTALFPNDATALHLLAAGQACVEEGKHRKDAGLCTEGKGYLQRALRMQQLLMGRGSGVSKYHTAVAEALEAEAAAGIPAYSNDTAGVCALCGESPEAAAIELKVCGRCLQVTYCSVGCQAANWNLHSKHCKA